jgi:hypothetical protein
MSAATSITVRVPLAIRHRPGRTTLVTPADIPTAHCIPTRADPAMVKALARAHRWQRLLDEGRYASISELAASEKLDRGYVGTILRLTLLAPDVIEAILDGRKPEGLGLPAPLEPFPIEWERQRSDDFWPRASRAAAAFRPSDLPAKQHRTLDHRTIQFPGEADNHANVGESAG